MNDSVMAKRRTFLKSAAAAGTLGLTGTAGCIGNFGSQPYGDGTLQFMMSPSEPQDYMRKQYTPVRDYLDEELEADADVELQYASNYSATLSALESGNGEVAETGPFAAALGVMNDQVEIALQRHAYGSWDYYSVIVTREDSDIEGPADLEGKEIAFADMTSASGSLYPLYMLKQAGLDIGEAPTSDNGADFSATWSGHAEAFSALMDGQVDAAGVGRFITWDYDAGDYKEGVKEVDVESGIPRAPIVTSPELDEEEKDDVVSTLENAPDEIYLGADGEADTDDDLWFDDVRPADLETYQPVIDVAQELDLDTDLLDEA
jgi:phosphonate transport system substrate-binding protein